MKQTEAFIKHPLATEKSVRLMEAENKLVFIVERKSTKQDIKEEAERLFKIKVEKINTVITPQGKKKAYLKLSPETPALDVATELGLI
ncbi:50S ribosomal protein L23 [Candidatus Woesearchaeota archaeon]|nr:50S ribosomal protein L23 [Candidatus Woesearchaeota archaeon]